MNNPIASRRLPDGRWLVIYPLLGRCERLSISQPAESVEDLEFMDDVWDYDPGSGAITAMDHWDGEGEPEGWMRHPASGRRRPCGDPSKEYVRA